MIFSPTTLFEKNRELNAHARTRAFGQCADDYGDTCGCAREQRIKMCCYKNKRANNKQQ